MPSCSSAQGQREVEDQERKQRLEREMDECDARLREQMAANDAKIASYLTPLSQKEEKKRAKEEKKRKEREAAGRINPFGDPDAVDYGVTPKTPNTADTDNSDAATEIKHDSLAQQQKEIAAREAADAAERLARAQAEKDLADSLREREKEKRKILADAKKLADAEARQRDIADNQAKIQKEKLDKANRDIDRLLNEKKVFEQRIAEAEALARAKQLAIDKLDAATKAAVSSLASTPVAPPTSASPSAVPPVAASPAAAASTSTSASMSTTGPLRSLTVQPMRKQLANGTSTDVWFREMADFTVDNVTTYDKTKQSWLVKNAAIKSALDIHSHFSDELMDRIHDTVCSTASYRHIKDDRIYIWDRPDLLDNISDYLQLMLPDGVPVNQRLNNAFRAFKEAIQKTNPLKYSPGQIRDVDCLTNLARRVLADESIRGRLANDHLNGTWGNQLADSVLRFVNKLGQGHSDDMLLMKELYEEHLLPNLSRSTMTLIDIQIAMKPFYKKYETAYILTRESGLLGQNARRQSGIHALAEAQDAEIQTEQRNENDEHDVIESEINYVRGDSRHAPPAPRGNHGQSNFKPIQNTRAQPIRQNVFGNARQRQLDQTRAQSPSRQQQGGQRPPTPPHTGRGNQPTQRPPTPPHTGRGNQPTQRPNTPPAVPGRNKYGPQPGAASGNYVYGRNSPQEKKQRLELDFCDYCGLTSHVPEECQHYINGHPGINLSDQPWLTSQAAGEHLACKLYHVIRGVTPQVVDGKWKMVPY